MEIIEYYTSPNKKSGKQNFKSYLLISLLPISSKVFE